MNTTTRIVIEISRRLKVQLTGGDGEWNAVRLPKVESEDDDNEQGCVLMTSEKFREAVKFDENKETDDEEWDPVDYASMNDCPTGESWFVTEYIGRESSSANWAPDTAIGGFTDRELRDVVHFMDNYFDKMMSGDPSYKGYLKSIEEITTNL